MVFKIDFEKAYDHVEWDFLDCVRRKGFQSYLEKVDTRVPEFSGILCYLKWNTKRKI